MSPEKKRSNASRRNLNTANVQQEVTRQSQAARVKEELRKLRAQRIKDKTLIMSLSTRVKSQKKQLKECEYKGPYKVFHTNMRRSPYKELGVSARFDRIKFWMGILKEMNAGSDLCFEARDELATRLLKGFEEEDNVRLSAEKTAEFFLSLGVSQNKFELIYQLLRSYKIPVPFAPYSSFLKFIQETPTGNFVTIRRGDKIGTVSSDIKAMVQERIQRLGDSGNLVYEQVSETEIKVKLCLIGDKGKEMTKFCFQPQVKDKNHSYQTLSVIGLWHGDDSRDSLDHFLNTKYDNEECRMPNGLVMEQLKNIGTIKLENGMKCSFEFMLTGDFLFIYSFMGFKGQASNFFCYYCNFYSRTRADPATYHKNQKTRWKDFSYNCESRSMAHDVGCELKELKKVGFKTSPLMNIEYGNILMPLLHIFMGMTMDTIKRLEVFLSNEEKDALYDCLKEIGIRVREYWEAVSGNGVNKIMKNIEKFLQILPDRNIIKDIKAILKQISQVYSLIFEAKLEDEMKLEEALDGLADAFMCGTFSKDYNITPKAHTLVCHAIEQLKLHGTLMLFSEQGQEALHNIMNKDLSEFSRCLLL